MPEEIEVPVEHLHEAMHEKAHEEAHGGAAHGAGHFNTYVALSSCIITSPRVSLSISASGVVPFAIS